MDNAPAHPTSVVLSGLQKSFAGRVAAVRDFNLTIEPGELLTLVGPSGCGKTTTLRMIAGLERPDAGLISLNGQVCNNLHPSKRNVAMVFQDATLYPHMSVRRNLGFPLRMQRLGRDEVGRRVMEAARLCGVEELLDRKPAALSGGEQQRAALARAIARQPAVLLLDEPLSNLDAPFRVRLRREIRLVQQRLGITTLHVTHDQEEAMAIGDRMAVMRDGMIQQVDTPLEVYRQPANRFVAGFIGQPAMNFILGRIVRVGQSLLFTDRGNIRIDLSASLGVRSKHLALGEVVLGVRPEHLRMAAPGISLELPLIRADQVSTELLGDRVDALYRTAAGDHLQARISPAEAGPLNGSRSLTIDQQHIHLFEPGEFGRHLLIMNQPVPAAPV